MKKRFLPILLLLLTLSLLSAAFVSCDDQKKDLQKLNAPVVVLEGDLATWSADTNADKFEISVDGSLSYLENTVTSKKLTDGQIFKIRAVGDNTSYATSDWSNAVTYSVSSDETDGNDQTTADQTDETTGNTDETTDNTDETTDNTDETTDNETNGDETDADDPNPPSDSTAKTPSFEVDAETRIEEATGIVYANIHAEATLPDSAFRFDRLEIYRGQTADATQLVSSTPFTGEADIREGILNNATYVVRLYYKNGTGAEQYLERYVFTAPLYVPWVSHEMEYGLQTHAILGFRFGEEENPCRIDNLRLMVWDEDSPRYIAKDALYLIDHPTALDDLQAELNTLDRFEDNEEFNRVYSEWHRLNGVSQQMESNYAEMTRVDWAALASGSVYLYEIALRESDDCYRSTDGMYYVILRDYFTKSDGDSMRYQLVADLDFNDGESAQPDQTLCEGFFNVSPAITDRDYLIIASDEDFNNLFTIDDNRLYLEVMSRNNLGNESYRALGYVNQIVLAKESSYDIVEVLWSQDAPDATIDEAAWLADVIEALLAGDEPDSVFPLGDLEPIEIDIHPTTKIPGNYHIRFTYRMLGKTYTDENPYDWDGAVVDYLVTAPLPTASITMEKEYPELCGAWEIVFPELTIGHYWDHYVVEICDANGTLLHTYTQENPYDRARLEIGQKIRIRLLASDGVPYYTDGEWSDWFICEPIKIQTPVLYTGYSGSDLTVWWYEISYAEKYLCTVNGIEQTVTETTLTVPNGAKVTVVAVPAEGGNCTSSDPSEEITATDTREQLTTPNVTFEVDSEGVMVHVRWDAVDGAARYEIYNVTEDRVVRMLGASNTSYVLKTAQGGSYRIRALAANHDEYRDSEYSSLISW